MLKNNNKKRGGVISNVNIGPNNPVKSLGNNNDYYEFYIKRRNIMNILVEISIAFLNQLLNFCTDINKNDLTINKDEINNVINGIKNIKTNNNNNNNLLPLIKNSNPLNINDSKINELKKIVSIDKILELFTNTYLRSVIITKNNIKNYKLPNNIKNIVSKILKNNNNNNSKNIATLPTSNNSNNVIETINSIINFKTNINKKIKELDKCLKLIDNNNNTYTPIGTPEYNNIAYDNINNTIEQINKNYESLISISNSNSNNYNNITFYNLIINYLNLFTNVYKLDVYKKECEFFCGNNSTQKKK